MRGAPATDAVVNNEITWAQHHPNLVTCYVGTELRNLVTCHEGAALPNQVTCQSLLSGQAAEDLDHTKQTTETRPTDQPGFKLAGRSSLGTRA